MIENCLKTTIIVMTRWPAPGRCKTRLAKVIGKYAAASIQNHLNHHTITVVKKLEERKIANIQIAISGINPKSSYLSKRYKIKNNILSQGSGNLGLRMRKQILYAKRYLKNKHKKDLSIIVIGADLPSLCCRDLMEAIEALKNNQLVIGPANDGGYWLIGISGCLVKPIPSWPFAGIPWGSNKVLQETLNKAKELDLSIKLLKEYNDLDLINDLYPWLN